MNHGAKQLAVWVIGCRQGIVAIDRPDYQFLHRCARLLRPPYLLLRMWKLGVSDSAMVGVAPRRGFRIRNAFSPVDLPIEIPIREESIRGHGPFSSRGLHWSNRERDGRNRALYRKRGRAGSRFRSGLVIAVLRAIYKLLMIVLLRGPEGAKKLRQKCRIR